MPDKCETCDWNQPKDRKEEWGDECNPFCERLNVWLDYYEGDEEPCK